LSDISKNPQFLLKHSLKIFQKNSKFFKKGTFFLKKFSKGKKIPLKIVFMVLVAKAIFLESLFTTSLNWMKGEIGEGRGR
jgi:hypothetical protein